MRYSKEELEKQKQERLGEVRKNKDSLGGYDMKIVKYNGSMDIIVEFQDEYKDLIPVKLYDAMYRYEVEIND